MKLPIPSLSDLAVIVNPVPAQVTPKTRSRVALAFARLLHPTRNAGSEATT